MRVTLKKDKPMKLSKFKNSNPIQEPYVPK
jgi:hypothetical protein